MAITTATGFSRPKTSRAGGADRRATAKPGRGLFVAFLASAVVCLGGPAFAHELMVSARDDGRELHVRAIYSNGVAPQRGEVRVLDAAERLLATASLAPDGRARLPSPDAPEGLRVEVLAGDHVGWWALTPRDIARQRAEAGAD